MSQRREIVVQKWPWVRLVMWLVVYNLGRVVAYQRCAARDCAQKASGAADAAEGLAACRIQSFLQRFELAIVRLDPIFHAH